MKDETLKIVLDTFIAESKATTKAINEMTEVTKANGQESKSLKQEMCNKLDNMTDEIRNMGNQFQNFSLKAQEENILFKQDIKDLINNEVGKVKSTGKWLTIFMMMIASMGSLFVMLRSTLVSNALLQRIYEIITKLIP